MADIGPGAGDVRKALRALRAPGPIYSRLLRAGGILIVGAITNPTKPGVPHGRDPRTGLTAAEQEAAWAEERARALAAEERTAERIARRYITDAAGLMRASTWIPGAMDP